MPKWSDDVFKIITASAQVKGDTVATFPAVGSILCRTVREFDGLSANLIWPEVMFRVFSSRCAFCVTTTIEIKSKLVD